MKKFFVIPIIILSAVIAFTQAQAATAPIKITISLPTTSFVIGQNLKFDYILANQTDSPLTVDYTAYVQCLNRPMAPLISNDGTLPAKGQIQGSFNDDKLTGVDPTQECSAIVKINDPQVSASQKFKIIGLPRLAVGVEARGNVGCPISANQFAVNKICANSVPTNIFLVNSNVLLNNKINVSGTTVQTVITTPSGSKKTITLPTVLNVKETGIYNIETTVKKSGYVTAITTYSLAVVGAEPKIALGPMSAGDTSALPTNIAPTAMDNSQQLAELKKYVAQQAAGQPYTKEQLTFFNNPQAYLDKYGYYKAKALLTSPIIPSGQIKGEKITNSSVIDKIIQLLKSLLQ